MNINATIFGQIIAFIIFVLYCMKYIWPPLLMLIEKRKKKINKILISTKKAKNFFKIIQNESFNYIKKTKKKQKKIINFTILEKNNFLKKAKVEANAEYDKIKKETKNKIKIKYKYAYKKLYKKINLFILMGLKKIIKYKINKKN